MYTIIIEKSAAKELKKIPIQYQKNIVNSIRSLENEPFPQGVKKIKGLSQDFIKRMDTDCIYRVRVADYRIIYTVFEEKILICVVKIGIRKDVYRFIK